MAETLQIRRLRGPGQQRTAATVAVRFSASEAAAIDAARALAGGLRRADYLRRAALTVAADGTAALGPAPELIELRRELGRIGGNLAQLLKASNFGNLPEAARIREVMDELGEVGGRLRAALS